MYDLFVNFMVLVFGLVNSVRSCPVPCFCNERKQEVRCYGRNLTNQIVNQIAPQIPLNIRKLYIRGGVFDSFPTEEFKRNRRLRELYISKNQLVEFPRNISNKFPNLMVLDVSGNNIEQIERKDMEGLESLRTLVLDNNKIASIGNETFVNLVRLRKLFISQNRIQKLTANTFIGLGGLSKLEVEYNQITSLVPGLFHPFQVPRITLSFSNNNITIIPNGLFKMNSRIKKLDLSHNRISEIDNEAFVDVTIMGPILLVDNQIERIPLSAIRNMSMGIFIMYQNPTNCSCEFYNTYVSAFTSTVQFVAACHYPKWLRGENVAELLLNRTMSEACPICDRLNITCQNEGVCLSINRTNFSCNCTRNYEGDYCERNRTFEKFISPTNITQNYTSQNLTTEPPLAFSTKPTTVQTTTTLSLNTTSLTNTRNTPYAVPNYTRQNLTTEPPLVTTVFSTKPTTVQTTTTLPLNTSITPYAVQNRTLSNSTLIDYRRSYDEVVASKILWLALLCIFLVVVITKLLYVMVREGKVDDRQSREFFL